MGHHGVNEQLELLPPVGEPDPAAITPQATPAFPPLADWLPTSTAGSLDVLEPWQRWQLAFYGRCRWPRRAGVDVRRILASAS